MTNNKHNHNNNSPSLSTGKGLGVGVNLGIHRFHQSEHNLILEELASHVDDLIRLTTGDHAAQKIKEFRSSFAGITDPQHQAYIIESARAHYSTLLRHTR